ncbi:Lrp/AsnC family transcriptional regulator, partial [Acinetobacter baumannii]
MLDATDRQLLALIRTDARIPVAKLAAALGVTRATARARLDRLVTTGVITGFTVTVRDPEPGGVRAVTLIE